MLRDADMVLAVDGQPVSSYNDVQAAIVRAAGAADAAAGQGVQGAAPPAKRARVSEEDGAPAAAPKVQLTVFRDGAVQEATVRCVWHWWECIAVGRWLLAWLRFLAAPNASLPNAHTRLHSQAGA